MIAALDLAFWFVKGRIRPDATGDVEAVQLLIILSNHKNIEKKCSLEVKPLVEYRVSWADSPTTRVVKSFRSHRCLSGFPF